MRALTRARVAADKEHAGGADGGQMIGIVAGAAEAKDRDAGPVDGCL